MSAGQPSYTSTPHPIEETVKKTAHHGAPALDEPIANNHQPRADVDPQMARPVMNENPREPRPQDAKESHPPQV